MAYDSEKRREKYLRHREKNLAYSHLRNSHVYRPDGRIPRAILVMVRLQCLQDGGDPGVPLDLQLAAIQVGREFDWLARGWLHPDSLVTLSKSWAQKWRDNEALREHTLKYA